MHLTERDKAQVLGTFTVVREPARADVAAQSRAEVVQTVSAMLSDIEQHGRPAVRRYAEQLDGWTGGEDFEIDRDTVGALSVEDEVIPGMAFWSEPLRVASPRRVGHGRLRRQGHARPEPRATDRPGARSTGGLSVTGHLKQLTDRRATRESTRAQAGHVGTIADHEGMPGHRDSAQLRLDLLSTDLPH